MHRQFKNDDTFHNLRPPTDGLNSYIMKDNTTIYNSEFGFVFNYNGCDSRGNHYSRYTVLARTPEELYEAMKDWHTYGGQHNPCIEPNANFRKHINAIFSIQDGSWEDRVILSGDINHREEILDRFFVAEPPFSHSFNTPKWHDLRTTGCGCWGIDVYRAEAPTLEEHNAIVNARREAEKAERIRIAKERTAKALEEFKVIRKGWYYVELEMTTMNINGRRVHKTFSGHTIAESKMDAYLKAANHECQDICAENGLIFEDCGEWNSSTTEVQFLGMKTDYGYSVEAWEEYMKANNDKNK